MFVMCRGTTCTFGRLTASGESVPEVTSFINTYTRDILLISQKKIEKSRIIIWPPTGCKKYGTIFFFFNGKKKTQAKLASASVTTWFNQRCVCRRFHSHFLHFFFSFFLSLQLLYYSSQRCVSASGRNMTSSPSLQSSSTQPPPTIPGCTLSAVIVHSGTYHFEKIVQMLLKPTIFRGCWSVSTASPARKERKKVWSCEVKEADEGRTYFPSTLHHSGWWFTCHLDALNNERPTRWQENLLRIWFVVVQDKKKRPQLYRSATGFSSTLVCQSVGNECRPLLPRYAEWDQDKELI